MEAAASEGNLKGEFVFARERVGTEGFFSYSTKFYVASGFGIFCNVFS